MVVDCTPEVSASILTLHPQVFLVTALSILVTVDNLWITPVPVDNLWKACG